VNVARSRFEHVFFDQGECRGEGLERGLGCADVPDLIAPTGVKTGTATHFIRILRTAIVSTTTPKPHRHGDAVLVAAVHPSQRATIASLCDAPFHLCEGCPQ